MGFRINLIMKEDIRSLKRYTKLNISPMVEWDHLYSLLRRFIWWVLLSYCCSQILKLTITILQFTSRTKVEPDYLFISNDSYIEDYIKQMIRRSAVYCYIWYVKPFKEEQVTQRIILISFSSVPVKSKINRRSIKERSKRNWRRVEERSKRDRRRVEANHEGILSVVDEPKGRRWQLCEEGLYVELSKVVLAVALSWYFIKDMTPWLWNISQLWQDWHITSNAPSLNWWTKDALTTTRDEENQL